MCFKNPFFCCFPKQWTANTVACSAPNIHAERTRGAECRFAACSRHGTRKYETFTSRQRSILHRQRDKRDKQFRPISFHCLSQSYRVMRLVKINVLPFWMEWVEIVRNMVECERLYEVRKMSTGSTHLANGPSIINPHHVSVLNGSACKIACTQKCNRFTAAGSPEGLKAQTAPKERFNQLATVIIRINIVSFWGGSYCSKLSGTVGNKLRYAHWLVTC